MVDDILHNAVHVFEVKHSDNACSFTWEFTVYDSHLNVDCLFTLPNYDEL